ncbi:saccharopine dehydrogenase NADP-binding domain-containing protein [Streptomyces sp. NPDC055663]
MLRELLARGETPTLVGRNRAKVLTLAERFHADLPVIEADATSTAALTRIVDRTDVVVSTVGPFAQLGLPAVTAAARAGAHYLDSTGEPPFIRQAFQLDAVATARGASIRPGIRLRLRTGQPRRRPRRRPRPHPGRQAGAPRRDRLLPHPLWPR